MFLVDWFYGILASLGLWQKEAKILFLGRNSGWKKALLDKLQDEYGQRLERDATSAEFRIGKIKFKAFALGGDQIARRVLRDYYAKVDAVVYMVNAFDVMPSDKLTEELDESRKELEDLLSDDYLTNVPILVLGNVLDRVKRIWMADGEEMSEKDLVCRLRLNNLTTGKGKVNLSESNVRPLEVFMCCLKPKRGYVDGFNWLSQYIK